MNLELLVEFILLNKVELICLIVVLFILGRSYFSLKKELKASQIAVEKLSLQLEVMQKDSLTTASTNLNQISYGMNTQFERITQTIYNINRDLEVKLNQINVNIDTKLFKIQSDNNEKLEKIREVVDEKLQSTLEKRLSETFKVVSERLEQVHRGIGEMQHLATGVGDLKKILSNVKTRGIWGEIQLGSILEQMLSSYQYAKNVFIREDCKDVVEFVIKIPTLNSGQSKDEILMPIDAKFPLDIYQRLVEALDETDLSKIEVHRKELEQTIKRQAKLIAEKYINIPSTTEFAIMFLPVEGLYAEVLRIGGLYEYVQGNYKVIITGPTTLSAIISSLQMGYKTLAIQKRSGEVWELLSTIRQEFGRFSILLGKTKLKLKQASEVIGSVESKTKRIEHKLKDIDFMHTQLEKEEEELEKIVEG